MADKTATISRWFWALLVLAITIGWGANAAVERSPITATDYWLTTTALLIFIA
jgi:hypothetical protein